MRRHKPKQSELKKSYSTGELICREGDESSEIYVIQEGRVEVVKYIHGQELKIGELNKGAFFEKWGSWNRNQDQHPLSPCSRRLFSF